MPIDETCEDNIDFGMYNEGNENDIMRAVDGSLAAGRRMQQNIIHTYFS